MNNRSSRSRTRGAATVAVMLGVALGFGATVHGAGREHPRVSDRTGETRRVEERARPTAAIPSREAAAARRLARERARRIAPPVMPQPTVSLADAAQQYTRELDQTAKLLRSWSELGLAARQREQIGRLLGAKTTELRTAGALLEEKFARIRAALLEHGTPAQQAEFDAFVREFRSRHEEVRDDLTAVGSSATAGGQQAAVSRLLGKLEGLRSRETRRRDRPTGQIGRPLPSQPVEFDKDAPSRESTVRPAYLGGGGAELMGDLDPTPDAQITPEIQALADSLGNSAVRIYEFVRDNTTFEPYFGSLKGSQAALETLAGNDYDLASLTIALLRASNIPARYVRGTVKIPTARAQDWLSVRHPDAVNQILNTAGISAIAIDFGGNGTVDWFEVDRVWVEAQVPHANYRGVDGSGGGAVWVPLDPAFKLRRHQAGIAGIPDSVPFDENGYLAARTSLLAYEWYRNQVRDWLETNMPGSALGDVPYKGTIIPQPLGVLPASLPHEAIAFTGEWAELPENLRHRFQVTLLDQFGGTVLDRAGLRTVETALKRVTISYSDGTDSAGLSAALGGSGEVPEFLVTLTPELKIEGVVDTVGTTVDSGNPIDVRVRYFFPDDSPIETVTHPRTAGEYHALIFDSHQVSETLLDRRSQLLIAANADVGTPAEDPDALQGELLNLIGLRYWQRVAQGDEALGELYQFQSVKQWFEILAGSNTTVQYLYDRPFAVMPGNMGVDSQRQSKGQFGIDGDQTKSVELFKLEGRNGSAQEHAVWEEVVYIDSVSTIKSLQFANETDINGNGTPNDGDVLDLTVPGQTSLLCPGFPAGAASSMEAALSAGQVVKTPYCDFVMNQWNGVGWIEEDPATGAGAYLISGFLAGGETTWTEAGARWRERAVSPEAATASLSCARRAGGEILRLSAQDGDGPDSTRLQRLPAQLRDYAARSLAAGFEVTFARVPAACPGGPGALLLERDPATGRAHASRWSQGPGILAGGSGTENPPGDAPDDPGDNDQNDDPNGNTDDPVTFSNGNMWLKVLDLEIPGRGFGIELVRAYASQSDYDGPLGYGWTHSYNEHLVENPDLTVTWFDPDGGTWLFTPDVGNDYISPRGFHGDLTSTVTGWDLREKNGFVHEFDTAGKLVSLTDRNGNQQSFGYTGANLTSLTETSGRTLTFEYDPSDRLTRVADWAGREVLYAYNGAGELQTVTDLGTGVTTYTYYADSFNLHNLATAQDAEGHVTSFAYYANDKCHQVVEPEGRTTTLTYEPLRRLTRMVDHRGGAWDYHYDVDGNVTRVVNPLGNDWRASFDFDFNQVSITDRAGFTTARTFDARGNLLTETDPLLGETVYTYDATFSLLTSFRDARLNTTTFTRDPATGNAQAIDHPDGARTEFEFNPDGTLSLLRDGELRETSYEYDVNGYRRRIVDAKSQEWFVFYDAIGRVTSIQDPALGTRTFTNDGFRRVTSATDAATGTQFTEYDAVGNKTLFRDQAGREWNLTYDGLGNLTSLTEPGGAVISYDYRQPECDCSGREVTAYTDPLGNRWEFVYDPLGRLIRETDPLGRSTFRDYDARGNLIARTDARGLTTTYDYDELSRIVTRTLDDLSTASYTWDPNGNLLSAANAATTVSYTYDARNRVLTETDSTTGAVITSAYDFVGNRTAVSLSGVGSTSYQYDPLNLVDMITGPLAETFTLTHTPLKKRATLDFPNGVTTDYSYDAQGRLTGVEYSDPTLAVVARALYGLDAAGRRTSLEDLDGVHSYGYDAAGRLAQVVHPLWPDEAYAYDAVGRRLSSAGCGQLAYTVSGELLGACGVGFAYDDAGNLIRRVGPAGTTTYQYDDENRLTQVTLPDASVVGYQYDALSRLYSRTSGGSTVRYLHDGLHQMAEYDGSNTLLAWYVRGPVMDEPLEMRRGGQSHYFLADGQGSVVALTDAAAAVTHRYHYDAYGNLIEESGAAVENPFRFDGRPLDEATGLYDFRARWYDPQQGRFLSRDPLGRWDGPDLYAFVRNDPVNLYDPLGLGSLRQRPLDIRGFRNTTAGWFRHDQIFFDDGQEPSNVGFFDDNQVRADEASQELQDRYEIVRDNLDDDLLRQAVEDVSETFERDYSLWNNNCQDFAQEVMDRYDELERERNEQNGKAE